MPTPATWGSEASGANVPPPKSRTKNCDSSGVVVSDMLATSVRSSVLLPLRGPPTTATWPAAPLRSTVRVSRRCSRGRSTVPSGTTSPPSARQLRRDQAELRVLDEVGHQLVEGVGHVERRQPHLVGGGAVAVHVVDGDVEQRLLGRRSAAADDLGDGLGLGLEREHLGDRERQDAARRARPRRGGPGGARLAGGPDT